MRLPARRPAGELRDGGQQQKTTEDAREGAWAESAVHKGARQRTRGAEQAEPHKDRAIYVGAQAPAADGRRRHVGQRHECHSRCGAESEGEQWRHQAADPESDDSGRGTGEDRDDEDRDEKHRAILSPPGNRRMPHARLKRAERRGQPLANLSEGRHLGRSRALRCSLSQDQRAGSNSSIGFPSGSIAASQPVIRRRPLARPARPEVELV